jgi:hypothetical protein
MAQDVMMLRRAMSIVNRQVQVPYKKQVHWWFYVHEFFFYFFGPKMTISAIRPVVQVQKILRNTQLDLRSSCGSVISVYGLVQILVLPELNNVLSALGFGL